MCLHSTFVDLSYNFMLTIFQEVEIFYTKLRAEAGPHLDVVFDNDEVVLELPKEGKTLPSGWTLQPLFYPPRVRKLGKPFTLILFHGSVTFFFQLLRRSVDNYKPGRTIHSCQVELVWKKPAERLSYMLHICGLRRAETYIAITRDPSLPGQDIKKFV